MLSSICFMPASLAPQSLPPLVPIMSSYFFDSTVVTCMRAGLYQQKNGLLVFFGVVAIEPVDDVRGDFLVHRLRALERERTFILAHLVLGRAVRRTSSTGPAAAPPCRRRPWDRSRPGSRGMPGIGTIFIGGTTACLVGLLLMSGKLTCCIASR